MSGTSLRRNGTLITHSHATYIPPTLMPGYSGHVPSTKFLYGLTFGNASISYFMDTQRAAMNSSQINHFPFIYPASGGLITPSSNHPWSKDRPLYSPYWAHYNVGFERQQEIKHFDELAQKHRENYKDKTGRQQPVSYFIIPTKKPSEKYSWEPV
ncbi:protein FAM166C B [Astyanax mexicanus]|uniref:Ciliary microtubule inner protein 2C n=1 Tax=Astyanax mexicanus TaxID=7994 RepID=W5K3X0_ASTMX|nr:protein FAM166C B [Astyanax mexicanus]